MSYQISLQKAGLNLIPIGKGSYRHLMLEEGAAFGCADPPRAIAGIERTQNPVNSRMTDATQLAPGFF
jgi:hypothetical protein